MQRLLIVAGVALIALTGSAFAQGTQGPGWGGFYVGGQGGYGWGDRDGCFGIEGVFEPVSECLEEGDGDFDYDQDGWLVGGQVGYNHMIGSILLGLEADAAFASISGEVEFGDGEDSFDGNGEWTWLAGFKARVGFVLDTGVSMDPLPKVLLFATGGLALAGYDFEGSSGCEFTQTRDGYLVGGGAEFKISQRASLKIEYNHMDLGSDTQPCTTLVFFPTHTEADATLDVVKFGFNYRF